ncbi:uncharacterized protein LOC118438803 [Folsomia candida]|uniref:Uncharacterized protein n=1 Tax=Folsomia candida TaxID=158441 RepID=A0A226DCG8_FOLCA|nr:uncharacterized protein LOC118438803 [Folsomia candida]OXA42524.1 hypothetical protein Fcan01_22912 [Folsomia candida]
MSLRLFAFVTILSVALGYVQEWTFYTEPNSGGNAFRFRTREPDLTQHQFFLRDVKSYCYQGYWSGFNDTNFVTTQTLVVISDSVVCINSTLPSSMSLKHLGPLETTTTSISIFNGTSHSDLGGIERTFTGLAANNFGFLPKYLVLTGGSSWTAFDGNDFSGNATCYSSSRWVDGIYPRTPIRSVVQGCAAKFDKGEI